MTTRASDPGEGLVGARAPSIAKSASMSTALGKPALSMALDGAFVLAVSTERFDELRA